jgi:hypothetical protein
MFGSGGDIGPRLSNRISPATDELRQIVLLSR